MNYGAYVVFGLGFGDEGKGRAVAYLCESQKAEWVIRYNGGPQAAHNVITDDGKHHTFAQFGSGMFSKDVKTYIHSSVLVDLIALANEADELSKKIGEDALSRMFINKDCVIVTPYDIAFDIVLAYTNGQELSSCCKGTNHLNLQIKCNGYAQATVEQAASSEDTLYRILTRKLNSIHDNFGRDNIKTALKNYPDLLNYVMGNNGIGDLCAVYKELFTSKKFNLVAFSKMCVYLINSVNASRKPLVFEGGQGVLLDQCYGIRPKNSWTCNTLRHSAWLLLNHLAEAGAKLNDSNVLNVGVTRAYHTKHGAGPLPTESLGNTKHVEKHNGTNPQQGAFRVGGLDKVLFIYAWKACMINLHKSFIAAAPCAEKSCYYSYPMFTTFITHMDEVNNGVYVSDSYLYHKMEHVNEHGCSAKTEPKVWGHLGVLDCEGGVEIHSINPAVQYATNRLFSLEKILNHVTPSPTCYTNNPDYIIDLVQRWTGKYVGFTSHGPETMSVNNLLENPRTIRDPKLVV